MGAARRARVEASRLAMLERHVRPPGDLLEVGPGHGGVARCARERGWRWFGLEPSPVLATGLRASHFPVVRAWTPPFPIGNACVDVVYADQVLEHMNGAPEARAFVSETARVLRPGGVALFVVPDYAKEGAFFWDIDYTHNFVTTERRMRQLLYDGGFDVLEVARTIGRASGLLRQTLAAGALVLNVPGVDAVARAVRGEEVLFRVRKNLFQTLTFVVAKS
ncbi:MAG TPA: class I SAM-dependent methyltransferase [Vicinamibacterales bacterium]|nr:class I SAM-dependent methyltransferase [Vicinamibacterales bacterium]